MGDWKPLIYSLIVILILTVTIGIIVEPYEGDGEYNQDSYISPLLDYLKSHNVGEQEEQSFSLTNPTTWLTDDRGFFILNPLRYIPDTAYEYLSDRLTYFSYVPNIIAIPFLIVVFFGVIYTVVRLLPFT